MLLTVNDSSLCGQEKLRYAIYFAIRERDKLSCYSSVSTEVWTNTVKDHVVSLTLFTQGQCGQKQMVNLEGEYLYTPDVKRV